MARTAIVFGLLLCGLSLFGMVAATSKSPFQFVPLMFGIPVLFCGVVGLNPHRRRISRAVAAAIMSLGLAVGLMETTRQALAWSDHEPLRPVLFSLGLLMSLACIVFVTLFLRRWFVETHRRRSRKHSHSQATTVGLAREPTPSKPSGQLTRSSDDLDY